MQKTKNSDKFSLDKYSDLIKTVARVEYSRLGRSSHLLEFSEFINIGATTVYLILSSQPENCHNNSYISTAIKWAIRNELRRRYKWYSLKQSSKKNDDPEASQESREELREAVYESILSIDELEQAENPAQFEDDSLNPEQKIELFELKNAIKDAMVNLSEKEKYVLDSKFFKNKKTKDLASELGVSSSRISKIVQSALDKIKTQLIKKGII
ncbi:MAG TPA: sigma-70 family RNA polymerase sigma factor [Candidatus Gastranaerophilales bacterium]|nr:sigma-70 family RNA polymerase sigma factor [Candidatus Gastranaerophilales bacterium]